MKAFTKFVPLLLGTVMVGFGMTACDDDDDDSISQSKVPEEVQETFEEMFPTVRVVDWELKNNYYKAEFVRQTFETDAWFKQDGTWAMTATDYGSLITELPEAVQETFNKSQYTGWIVDGAVYYERTSDSFCEIEVETDGSPDISVFYDTDGNYIGIQQSNFVGEITPDTVVKDIVVE